MASSSEYLSPTFSVEDSRAYVEGLKAEAENHRALHHPYLKHLAEGSFPDPIEALKDFTFQYLSYSHDFLRYLTVTISHLEDRKHRELLVNNLTEESGQIHEEDIENLKSIGINPDWIRGVPHPELFMRFLDALGMDQSWRKKNEYCDEAKIWSKMFLNCCSSGGPAQAVGAMGIGTENIVKYIYKPILVCIKKFTNVSPRDRVFFDLHAELDDEHGEILSNIAVDYARFRRYRPALRNGMLMSLNLRVGFFDAMMVRACSIVSGKVMRESMNTSSAQPMA